ncbi:hypothetical protein RJP21_01985 [Paenibacillus sp. VCA1]|uniref:hypothetical protein n=1 Tax=Paenibacillus sp. VCA1 TaxID=3039148 RepID=UPI002872668C|nr:hypothetical protein [Paenibacillus sp. VCA1]MDR9852367.1 hypothetical protein [Paenibacillus sp. VCA1]
MKKAWRNALWSGVGVIVFGVIVAGLYVQNIGFDNIKLMYTLHSSNKAVVLMGQGQNGTVKYLTNVNHPAELLKERMNKEGWNYAEQNGSGYFFEKGRRRCIVTVKQWNHGYFIYAVEKNLVNLAG